MRRAPDPSITRRAFLTCCSSAMPAAIADHVAAAARSGPGRFTARLSAAPATSLLPAGEYPLGLSRHRDGLLYVPAGARRPTPLVVLLHGATGSAGGIVGRLGARSLAEDLGHAVLAPDSRDVTWDMVNGYFGPDVAFIDRALAHAFARVAVDPDRLAIAGFSDGASYALTLGLMNGDLFTHVVAFSPGFLRVTRSVGHPVIYITHGTRDDILPIRTTSRRLAPALTKAGYTVRYREFVGSHTVPADIARDAFTWVRDTGASAIRSGVALAGPGPAMSGPADTWSGWTRRSPMM